MLEQIFTTYLNILKPFLRYLWHETHKIKTHTPLHRYSAFYHIYSILLFVISACCVIHSSFCAHLFPTNAACIVPQACFPSTSHRSIFILEIPLLVMLQERDGSSPPKLKRRRTILSRIKSLPSSANAYSSSTALQTTTTSSSTPNGAKWFRKPSVVWFRGHDLRVEDHPALLAAAQRGGPVVPLFIWDDEDQFGRDLGDSKKWWLRRSLQELSRDLNKLGVQLYTREGRSTVELRDFLKCTGADAVFWNRCYEPALLHRDEEMRRELGIDGMTAESFKAELLVEPWELSNTSACPAYNTFHDYMRAWMAFPPPPQPFPCPSRLQPISTPVQSHKIQELGLDCPATLAKSLSKIWIPGSAQAKIQLDNFLHEVFPAFGEGRCRRHFEGTSRLSPHIRFGELSPRRMYHATRVRVSRWDHSSPLCSTLAAAISTSTAAHRHAFPDAVTPADGADSTATGRTASPAVGTKNRKTPPRSSRQRVAESGSNCSDVAMVDSEGGTLEKMPNGHSRREKRGRESAREVATDRVLAPAVVRVKAARSPFGSVVMPHISLSARAFLKNLCLRDFSYHVLFHHPDFDAVPLVPEFSKFPWASDDGAFESWRNGKTGYPIVDAAMRELRATGWVHNAMRFLLACFLTKYLLLPWQRGLKEFYDLLLDGDHSANALGWQWTSGSNTDAFPFSCLVNPVKIGSRQDPRGDYVRKWIPELAKLPSQYIHQPWKASRATLAAAGLELGRTYPARMVDTAIARRRAREAMLVMKQVFASMRPSRTVTSLPVDDLLRDWPQDSDLDAIEESTSLGGKMGLLPSLWSLLHCDDPPNAMQSSASGTEQLLGMDTASLAEGALAMPLGDNHDSIEHALMTAHAQSSHDLMMSDSIPNLASHDDGPAMRHASSVERRSQGNGRSMEREDEKDDSHMSRVAEPPTDPVAGNEAPRTSHAMAPGPAPPPGMVPTPTMAHAQYPVVARPQAQVLHPPSNVMPAQMNQANPPGAQQMPNGRMMFDGMYNPSVASTTPAGLPLTNFPVMMGATPGTADGAASTAVNPTDIGALYAQQLGLNQLYGFQPMMIPTHRVPGGEREQARDAASTAAAATAAAAAAAAAATARQLGVPSGFPMGYGVYGNNAFDPSLMGGSFGSDMNPYGLHVPGQAQGGPIQGAPPQCPVPHPLYMGNSTNPEPMQGISGFPAGGRARNPVAHNMAINGHRASSSAAADMVGLTVPGQGDKLGGTGPMMVNDGTVRGSSATAATSTMQATASTDIGNLTTTTVKTKGSTSASGASASGGSRSAGRPAATGSASRRGSGAGNRKRPTNVVRGRETGKAKRGAAGRGGRSRADSRSSAPGGSGPGSGRSVESQNVQKGTASKNDGDTALNDLKKRQRVLDHVGQKEDHEYFHFAQFLTKTYELTGNTDRHSSKDYVRLCNLKDSYHKQCQSDKEKLKIYRIKTFFSKILQLEVTGEWDRHNHGGVRGPYVYGIREKAKGGRNDEGAKEGGVSSEGNVRKVDR